MLCLDDPSVNLRATALNLMATCEHIDVDVVRPFAEAESKRVRGAALRVLAHHDREHADEWLRTALADPSPCVRVEAARGLDELDPAGHRGIFMLALHDPNPDIVKRATKLAKGKGFATWRH
jgi:HEAT repeat protein